MEGCQPMAKVLFFLLLTVAGSGLAAYAAWNSELWEPWVEAKGHVRGDRAFDFDLKAFVAAAVSGPLTLLIGALLQVGADRGATDIHGYTVLKLRTGPRTFMVLGCLLGVALFLAYPLVDPAASHPWAFQGAALLMLLAISVTLRASIRHDRSTVSIPNFFGGRSVHRRDELTDVIRPRGARFYLFGFRDARKVQVSLSYQGLNGLLQTAAARLGRPVSF